MDPLTDVLRAVRLSGAFFYLVEAAPPWSISTEAARDLVPRVLPDAEHLISYHILVSGTCWGGLDADSGVHMQPGDVIVFPHGDPHIMSSTDATTAGARQHLASSTRHLDTVFLGPSAARDTTLVCGFLGCDVRPYNPLVASLPRQIHARGIASGWLSQFPRQAVTESRVGGIGSETMLRRMAELLFVEAVRHHLEQSPRQDNGWLSGLTDPVVGPALSQLHERPSYAWTLGELARTIASSRTVLAERFTQLVGVPPMEYLTRWRLQLAAEQLSRSETKVAAIGEQVGYESPAAFSRAFKRETGLSPAAWREARQRAPRPNLRLLP
jgi:AraC-like DNA-binding protein